MDDLDVGKSRLPWTAAGDRVGRATAFGGGRRAPGRGRRPWARRGRGGVGAGAAWARWRRAGGAGSERTGARGRRAAPAACERARGAGRVARRRRGRREMRGVEKQKGRRTAGVGYFE
jgi:hypothetical protein